jgi:hypothetical protein
MNARKEKSGPLYAADAINDAIEEVTLEVTGASDPDEAHVAGKTNEQFYIADSERRPLPDHIDPKSPNRIAREQQSYIEQLVTSASPTKSKASTGKNAKRQQAKRKT